MHEMRLRFTFKRSQFKNKASVTVEWEDRRKTVPLLQRTQNRHKEDYYISWYLNLVCLGNILKTKTQL